LSGNVREKLRVARSYSENSPEFDVNVQAFEAVQPKDLDAGEIDVRLGALWIEPDYVRQFMFETFETPMYTRRFIQVRCYKKTAAWSIEGKKNVSEFDVTATVAYGTKRLNAYEILESTLNKQDARVFDMVEGEGGNPRRVLNRAETALAAGKQEAINQAFADWLWSDRDRRKDLTEEYNSIFNSRRAREYDGKHLTFAGMNPEIKLRPHQLNAVARILYGKNTLLAHVVGAGKSFEMIAAAMESKRLGLCPKSMFVVPNHIIEQMASEFLRLYPAANILAASKKDFETANRKKFCARIATGDWDAVIIGHSQFEKIPLSAEYQEKVIEKQIDEIIEEIERTKFERGDRLTQKQQEKTRKSLEAKLEKLRGEGRKDDVISFEALSIKRLYVDEAHNYKDL
jgi:N12 class adenine-specific DNA methylase